ncbi:hypothetical protein ACHAPJ_002455 [Fusarium lateritium]
MQTVKPTHKIVHISSLWRLDELVDLAAEAFIEDPYWSTVVPGRHEYPESFRQIWSRQLLVEHGKKGTVTLAVCRDGDDGRSQFLGFAIWSRHGTSDATRSWQGQDDTRDKKLTRIRVMWNSIIHGEPLGVSDEDRNEAAEAFKNAERLYPAERWHLSYLAVSPKFQRRGVGKSLVSWGLERCEEEGVPAVLEASVAGRSLYENMGFCEIGRVIYDKGRRSTLVMLRSVEETEKTMDREIFAIRNDRNDLCTPVRSQS